MSGAMDDSIGGNTHTHAHTLPQRPSETRPDLRKQAARNVVPQLGKLEPFESSSAHIIRQFPSNNYMQMQQKSIKSVNTLAWSIGGHNHLDLTQVFEPVQLVQQLHQRALNFPIQSRKCYNEEKGPHQQESESESISDRTRPIVMVWMP